MGGTGLQGFIQMGTCSDLALLIWPSAMLSRPDTWTWFGYVSDTGGAIVVGES